MNSEAIALLLPERLLSELSREEPLASRLAAGVAVEEALGSVARLTEELHLLSAAADQALRLIVARFAGSWISPSRLETVWTQQGGAGADLAAAVTSLRRKGLLFAVRRSTGETGYVVPADHVRAWHRLLFAPDPGGWAADGDIAEVRGCPADAAGALFRLLAYVDRYGLTLTRSASIPKRDALRLGRFLPPSSPAFAPAHVRFGSGTEGGSAGVLLEAAVRLGVMRAAGSRIEPDVPRLHSWLRLSAGTMNARLMEEWRAMYVFTDAAAENAAALIRLCPRGVWVRFDLLLRHMTANGMLQLTEGARDSAAAGGAEAGAEHTGPAQAGGAEAGAAHPGAAQPGGPIWDCVQADQRSDCARITAMPREHERIVADHLDPLHLMGWAELGTTKDGGPVFRLLYDDESPAGPQEHAAVFTTGKWYVQPDFEVLVPKDVPYLLLWELEKFADLQRIDVVSVYRLTRGSWQRTLSCRQDVEERLAVLQENAMYGIPVNVRLALGEWMDELAGAWKESEEQRRVNDGTTAEVPSAVCGADGAEINRMRGSLPQAAEFCLEEHLPDRDELFPGWRKVPAMWLKECRAYHNSTQKQMASRAAEWKTRLLLRSAGGKRFVFPLGVGEDGGRWWLHALENKREIRLLPEDWKEMQILLPEC